MATDRLTLQDPITLHHDTPLDTQSAQVSEDAVVDLIEGELRRRLTETRARWDEAIPSSALSERPGLHLVDELREFTGSGGKRVRPRMCFWGWVAAAGDTAVGASASTGLDDVVRVGVALELLHCFGLVQDDVMDESQTRRGRSAVHVRAARQHADRRLHGDSPRFGESIAVLISDLALAEVYGVVMGLPERLRSAWQQMTIELISGQSLDLIGAATDDVDLDTAIGIARAKSGHYTVTRPLQLGAMAAGAGEATVHTLGRYGDHVGLAFALRDDLLAVLGDPARSGKPVADDLRDRKPTVLRALARDAGVDLTGSFEPTAAGSQSGPLQVLIEQLAAAGVIGAVEEMIDEQLAAAEQVLQTGLATGVVQGKAGDGLRGWARTLGHRQH